MNYKFRVWRTLFKCGIGLIFVSVRGLVTAVKCCWHLCDFLIFFFFFASIHCENAWRNELCPDLDLNKPFVFTMWAGTLTNNESGVGEKEKNGLNLLSTMTVLSAVCCYTDFVMYKQYGTTSRREHVFRLILEVALNSHLLALIYSLERIASLNPYQRLC